MSMSDGSGSHSHHRRKRNSSYDAPPTSSFDAPPARISTAPAFGGAFDPTAAITASPFGLDNNLSNNEDDPDLTRASTAHLDLVEAAIPLITPTVPFIDEDAVFRSSSKQKICLTESEETLLAALFLRVQDARSAESITRDPYAQATLDRCDVDFSRSTFSVGENHGNVVWAAHRARTLDDWCVDFVNSSLTEGPITVVHIGCGLDGRYLRVRDRFIKGLDCVHWIDIDRPMIVDLRDRIFRRPAPGSSSSQYMLRTLDISQKGWTRDIPKPAAGQPTLVVAEGQFCYLEPATVYNILNEVVEYFGTGQIAFDKLGTLAVTLTSRVKFLKASRATFTWAVDDPREIEDMCPRLRLKECIDKKKFMNGCIPIYGKLNPFVSLHPGDKYNGQFVLFEF